MCCGKRERRGDGKRGEEGEEGKSSWLCFTAKGWDTELKSEGNRGQWKGLLPKDTGKFESEQLKEAGRLKVDGQKENKRITDREAKGEKHGTVIKLWKNNIKRDQVR